MVLHILIRSLGFFVAASVCVFAVSNGVNLFTWHPILMTTGFILLMTEALSAFTSNTFLTRGLKYGDRLNLHGALQFAAGTSIGIAFWAIYTFKADNKKAHFESKHASMGLTTVLTVAGVTSGGIAARFSGAFKNAVKPAYLKIIHSTAGVFAYGLAIYTFCLGLDTEWFHAQSSDQWVQILTYAMIALSVLAVIKPLISIAGKVRNSTKSN